MNNTPDASKIENDVKPQPKKRGRKKKVKVVESKIKVIDGPISVIFD